jgi:hypothetical protein
MEQVSIRQPSALASAVGKDKTIRPPDVTQVIQAIALGAESFLKVHQCPWVVFVHAADTTPSNRWSQLHPPERIKENGYGTIYFIDNVGVLSCGGGKIRYFKDSKGGCNNGEQRIDKNAF